MSVESAVEQLVREKRAISVAVAGVERFIAAEDAALYRDALGCALPLGLPVAFTDPVQQPLLHLVARYARTHGPFVNNDVATRFGTTVERVAHVCEALESDGRLVRGEFRPAGVEREWCDVEVLRQLRRRSLAMLRKEVEPVEQAALGRFLPSWHHIDSPQRGMESLVNTLGILQGAAIVASTLEVDVLPLRVQGYKLTDLDELCASGEVVWVGSGAIGANDGRIRLFFADQLPMLSPGIEMPTPLEGESYDAIRTTLAQRGAIFFSQLRASAPGSTDAEVLAALWDLVWNGEVTNDTFAPMRALLAGGKSSSRTAPKSVTRAGRPRPGRLSKVGPPTGAGRWSLVAPLRQPAPTSTAAAHAFALQMLERHGVLTREAVLGEGAVGGFASVYGVLKTLEERGHVRRGYFVDGLGAAQFALPGAVDRLRDAREPVDAELHPEAMPRPLVLAATDPSQPYGSTLPWPTTMGRPTRSAGALVVLVNGEPAVWCDPKSYSLVVFDGATRDASWAHALVALVGNGRRRSLEIRKVDGVEISPNVDVIPALKAAGFVESYRGWVFRG
jgi:ATP-dependent Lhr-like helicase